MGDRSNWQEPQPAAQRKASEVERLRYPVFFLAYWPLAQLEETFPCSPAEDGVATQRPRPTVLELLLRGSAAREHYLEMGSFEESCASPGRLIDCRACRLPGNT